MGKSLKEQNNWKIWLIVACNALFFYGIFISGQISIEGINGLFSKAEHLLPIGIAGIVATVINSLPSSELKAKLVFLRWQNALPGHRAFSVYAARDPRINTAHLTNLFRGKLPEDPRDQNTAWYKLYRSVENDIKVYGTHRDFLLLRDYTVLSLMFVVFFGSAAIVFVDSTKTIFVYLGLLVAQFLVVRQAASSCGVRLVTNVLAIKSAEQK